MGTTGVVSINWTIIIQLINTLIICIILGKFLVKPIHDIIEKRQKAVDDSLDRAEKKNAEALELKEQYDFKIKEVQKEGRELLGIAKRKADERSREIIDEANRQAEQLKLIAQKEIESEKNRSLQDAKEQIVSIAVVLAEKILEKELDEKEQTALLDRILQEIGDRNV